MKKIIYILGISAVILSAICFANAQTQKFDVMTYTPPKGWTVGQNGQAKTFTTIDKAAGTFCVMLLYPSVTNHGTPSQDFAYVWKTLVQETFNAGGNPEKETTEADGFTMISGGELIDYEGNKALALLTTVSGKGKIISLLSIFNDAKYADDVQKFLGGIDIDIKETPKIDEEKAQVDSTSPTKASSVKKDILGEWYLSDGSVKISLWFAVNGHYRRRYQTDSVKPIALNLYQTTTFEGDGTYTLSGTTLKIIPKNGSAETHQVRVAFEKNSDGKVEKKLYLVRPTDSGGTYESEFWFVK
jgi:hypothetical protein